MPLQTLASDPLEGYSGLSLFARTFASFPNPPRPYDPDDLQHSHDFLKSMPLQSPNKLIEQAKAIVNNISELVSLDMSSSDVEVMENPRERRPALGRKRARFSLKLNSSLPTVSLDIDKLKEPEEFFVAFERAENAKREIQKQTGSVLMDLDQNIQSVAVRPRRPGILGRSVKYKHLYSTAMSPVKSFEEEILSPLCSSQQEKPEPNVELQGKELTVINAENEVNELLDHLLTSNYDGDEAVSLLQERLQIKPIDLEKICLPDLQDIRRIDLKASRENLAKPRNPLSNIQSLMKGISKRTPKRLAESSVHHLASPTLPRSPLASISLLKKQMLQSNVLSDPFSTDDIYRSPVRNVSRIESISKQSDQVDTEKELSVSHNNDRITPQQQPESSAHHLASPTARNPLVSISLQKKQMLQSDQESTPFSTDDIDQTPNESNPAMDEDHTMHGSLSAAENGLELHEQQNKKGKTKPRPCNKHKRKALSQRQSLAGSGTTFDAEGRRRSTRIRSRPLEFWKGERFLYGRVHSSLATVIGIKYESPGKADGGKPTLKVKSFVSDEYKDLIEQAARF